MSVVVALYYCLFLSKCIMEGGCKVRQGKRGAFESRDNSHSRVVGLKNKMTPRSLDMWLLIFEC